MVEAGGAVQLRRSIGLVDPDDFRDVLAAGAMTLVVTMTPDGVMVAVSDRMGVARPVRVTYGPGASPGDLLVTTSERLYIDALLIFGSPIRPHAPYVMTGELEFKADVLAHAEDALLHGGWPVCVSEPCPVCAAYLARVLGRGPAG